jgi:NAD(P)H-nitrite reductase large subunit
VAIRTNARLQAIEDAGPQKRLRFEGSEDLPADLVIMATGIRTNLDWLKDSGLTINRGIVVDAQQRSSVPNVYAAGDTA